jgi:hypothetical protein
MKQLSPRTNGAIFQQPASERRVQRHLRFTLANATEAGAFAGAILEGLDPTNGTLMPLATQLLVQNKETGKIDAFFPRDIGKFDLPERVYGAIGERRMQIYAPSKVEHDAFVDDLKRNRIEITLGEGFGAPNNFGLVGEDGKLSFLVQIEGEVNDTHKRALAKILINFAAHYLGYDEVQKAEWTAVKRYVRYGEGELGARFSEKPFWNGLETDDMRLASDSINIRLENHAKGLVGAIQFYNHPTYELLLIEGYNTGREIAYHFTPGSDPLPGQRGNPALTKKAG